MFKEFLRSVRDKFLPSQEDKPKVQPGFRPKAHPLEELVRPETWEGHGTFTRRYRYMTLGPNRKERRGMAKRVRAWDRHRGVTPSGVDPAKYHVAMRYEEWVLLNAPTNKPAQGHKSMMDGREVFIPYVPNNPMYGVTA